MSAPDLKPGRLLSQSTVKLITDFYESYENSRMVSGKRDCASVRTDEGHTMVQKRFVLMNLRELHQFFKDRYLNKRKGGLLKICRTPPKTLYTSRGKWNPSVCVCTHQNIKLMMQGIKCGELTTSDGLSIQTHQHCIIQVICHPPLHR